MGNLTGDVSKWTEIGQEDLLKVQTEQSKIFYRHVAKKLKGLKSRFIERRKNSIDPKRMILKEIDDVQNIIIKDRYKFQGKPVANETITIGAYSFRMISFLQCIQEMYAKAIDGTMELGIVPLEKQKIGVAALNAKVL